MIEKTKEYDLFIFREDNREKIDQAHVRRLIESIKAKDLLHLRPIDVNDKMEIIDGQHRVLAAKYLGVEVYYKKEAQLDAADIVRMNISKAWTTGDYLNFYCHHQKDEYIKLKAFMKKNRLTLKVALNIAIGESKLSFSNFKAGAFEFNEGELESELGICWKTIEYIRKMNGYSAYTTSSRFWRALLKLINHPDFDIDKWNGNVQKLVDHFAPKARTEDYIKMVQTIYNWKNLNKIRLIEDEL